MGVILPVYFSADTGATTHNAYASLLNGAMIPIAGPKYVGRPTYIPQSNNHSFIIISRPATGGFVVSATVAVFASQDARNQKRTQVGTFAVHTTIDNMDTNIAAALYSAVKVKYPDAVTMS